MKVYIVVRNGLHETMIEAIFVNEEKANDFINGDRDLHVRPYEVIQ